MNAIRNIIPVLFLLITYCSCTKSDSPESFQNFNKVKLFSDSLAYPSTGFDRIVAGNNRLFMIYYHWDGSSPTSTTNFLVTDNEGNLIKYDSLPAGMFVIGLVSLSNESFVIVALNPDNIPHFLHYNKDGDFISNKSLQLPGASQLLSASRSQSGNVLICSTDNAGGNYILDCNANADVIWSNETTVPIDGNFPTLDGGYLFSSTINGNDFTLTKTNGTGDIIWQKTFYTPNSSYCYWMASLRNGHFRACVNDLSLWQYNFNIPPPLTVYELSESGDSIRANTLKGIDYNFAGPILERNDGSTFMLMTPYFFATGIAVPTIVNTHYVTLDADLNIIGHGVLQDQGNDFFDSACKTSDGRIVCFGVIQSYKQHYYKPALVILN